MSWTEDRVATLRKLWGEGRTAAEIAKELGGVTRNAVIGKAHRLKLSGRVSPIQQNKKPVNKTVERRPEKKAVVVAAQSMPSSAAASGSASAIERRAEKKPEKLCALTDLGPRQCRWPIGDPREEDFGFCGDSCHAGLPYCADHAKVAYQAATRSRILQAEAEQKDVNDVAEELENIRKAAG